MKLIARGFSVNGYQDLKGIIVVTDDAGQPLGHEYKGNFSDAAERERVIGYISRDSGIDKEMARKKLTEVLQSLRKDADAATQDDAGAHGTHGAPAGGEWSSAPAPYLESDKGIEWLKPVQGGTVPVQVTNFTAKITADVIQDDGAEISRQYEIEAVLGGQRHKFTVSAGQFAGMNWPGEHLGAQAIVYPGQASREHARTAIQVLSGGIPVRRVYAHTGWRHVNGQWVYLHAGGAIGAAGPMPDIQVSLAAPLDRFSLPSPPTGEQLIAAVRKSREVLRLAPLSVTLPVWGSVFRAPLGSLDFTVHGTGPTGAGKSELYALAQQHFGAAMHARNLPGSWLSTANANEMLAFYAKDAVFVVDDFAPGGTMSDIQRLNREADRLMRGQGNSQGRHRLRSDATLRPPKPPRGLILSTGEDIPHGQSLRARIFVNELDKDGPRALDWALLTACQRDAADGVYASVISAYVMWLSPQYEEVRASLKREKDELRKLAFQSGQHRRTPDIIASITVGLSYFLRFAHDVRAVSAQEADDLWAEWWIALGEAAAAQAEHQESGEPTKRFLELVSSAISSGKAHAAAPDGTAPYEPRSWGWRVEVDGTAKPLGVCVGWVDGDDLYLEPHAAYAEAQRIARDTGDGISVSLHTLKRRLKDKGVLASTEQRGGKEHLMVRRVLGGHRREVLHMRPSSLTSEVVSQVSHEQLPLGNDAAPAGTPGGTLPNDTPESVPRECPTEQDDTANGTRGTQGTLSREETLRLWEALGRPNITGVEPGVIVDLAKYLNTQRGQGMLSKVAELLQRMAGKD